MEGVFSFLGLSPCETVLEETESRKIPKDAIKTRTCSEQTLIEEQAGGSG